MSIALKYKTVITNVTVIQMHALFGLTSFQKSAIEQYSNPYIVKVLVSEPFYYIDIRWLKRLG